MVLLPQGTDLTLTELRGVAARQQKQIEAHQQLLVAKEQRLKFLKQQEARHHQGAQSTDVNQLRECVEAQELKLRRLRALRGQVEQHRTANNNLSTELDSIRALFNEKEKELSLAVAKVEDLTRQLEELRMGGIQHGPTPSLELEKLKRELLFRTRLNEQHNARLGQQRETLARKQAAMSHMDQRIAELQQRLHRKRLLNQQLSNQLQAATQPKPRPALVKGRLRSPALNIAAVEPLKRPVPEADEVQDDPKAGGDDDLPEFTKKDPKYQTLPPNTKFPGRPDDVKSPSPPADRWPEVPPPTSPPPARGQSVSKPAPPHGLGHLVPRPYGSTYNSSLLGPLAAGHVTPTRRQHVPPRPAASPGPPTQGSSPATSPAPWTKPTNQNSSHQVTLPPTIMTEGAKNDPPPAGPQPPSYRASLRRCPPGPSATPKQMTPLRPVPPPRQAHSQGSEGPRGRFPPHHHHMYSRHSAAPVKAISPTTSEEPQTRPSPTGRLQGGGHFAHRPEEVPRKAEMPPTVLFPKEAADSDPAEGAPEEDRGTSLTDRLKRRPYVESQSCPTDLDQVTSSLDSDQTPSSGDGGRSTGSSTDSSTSSQEWTERSLSDGEAPAIRPQHNHSATFRRTRKGNLKTTGTSRVQRRVSFDPLALLLDAALEGELELVKKTAREVPNPSAANDEGITALHNAICAGHFGIVKFLVEFGCDVNAQDSDGWTPLHCAASCNNLPIVKFLVEHGACIFATTLSDLETAAEKCEEDEEGFDGCTEYLYSTQEKLGILNGGAVYAVHDYDGQNADELTFREGDKLLVLRKGDETEREWWWSRLKDQEGYVPRNLLGLYPRVTATPSGQST